MIKIISNNYNKRNLEVFVRAKFPNNKKDNIWVTLHTDRRCNKYKYIAHLSARYLTDNSRYDIPYCIKDEYTEGDIYIGDIISSNSDIGNGSILLRNFIELCKYTKSKNIISWLSPVDKDHFDKLEYFYKKHGFDVTFNETREYGIIKYSLKGDNDE